MDALDVERYELNEPRRYTFELERRDFIRLFGAGLAVLVAAPTLRGQESGRPLAARDDVPDLAAWLHIDEAGQVTACTGKVEIGQNIRTSLSQTVADELRVPLASITMVMGDTGPHAVRHGYVRIADDATHGAAARPGRRDGARDADRSGRHALADLTRSGLVGRMAGSCRARRSIDVVR